MQDGDLFMGLAGIAGVFVGFAALIAVRSGGPTDPLEVAPMRMMASMAMLTIVAALAPVTLGRYDLTDHQVWALSSALVLVGFALIPAMSARTPEYRAGWSTSIAETRLTPRDVVVLGVLCALHDRVARRADRHHAGRGTGPRGGALLHVVVLILLAAGWVLLELVFSQRRAASE